MKTPQLTFFGENRDRALAEFFVSQTSVEVNVATPDISVEPGLHDGERRYLRTDIVCPLAMRSALERVGVRVPVYKPVNSAAEVEMAFRGNQPVTVRVGSESQFAQFAIDAVLPYHRLVAGRDHAPALVELPRVGTGHWVLGIVDDAGVHIRGILDLEWKDEVRRFPVAVSAPSSLEEQAIGQLQNTALDVAKALGIDRGPYRVECVLSDGEVYVTEVDRGWFGGGLPVDLLQLSGIADFWGEQCRLLNIEAESRPLNTRSTTLRWLRSRSGIVEAINGVEDVLEMPGILQLQVDVAVGDRLGHVVDRHNRDRLGFLIVYAESSDKARTLSTYAVESVVIHRRTVIEE